MKRKINKIKLFIKECNDAKKIAEEIKDKLISLGFKIVDEEYDLALSIGGDGTFLKMIHANEFKDIYYAGINAGALGYLTNIDITLIDKFIESISNNNFVESKESLIESRVTTNIESKEYYSLNEIIIKKINQSTLKSDILVNRELLEKFVGDGILISTANGSTAYNLSYNGPIIDTELDGLILTPIAPINNKIYHTFSKSIVLSSKRKILINFKDKENICLLIDGKIININNVLKIESNISKKNIKIIKLNTNYIKNINTKIIGE